MTPLVRQKTRGSDLLAFSCIDDRPGSGIKSEALLAPVRPLENGFAAISPTAPSPTIMNSCFAHVR